MGLLFQMPVEHNELDDRIKFSDKSLSIRSYGLPMIFWGYLLAILSVLFFMALAIKGPLYRAYSGPDEINKMIAIVVFATLTLAPLILISLYFYEKELILNGNELTIRHKIFFLPLKSCKFKLNRDSLYLEHNMDSQNIAAQEKKDGMAAFENRGYFKLMIKNTAGKAILVDRNSRRAEMRKLKELLESRL